MTYKLYTIKKQSIYTLKIDYIVFAKAHYLSHSVRNKFNS